MIREVRIAQKQDYQEVCVYFQERSEPLRNPEVRKAAIAFLEEALARLKRKAKSKDVAGGGAGEWRRMRREDILLEEEAE